MSIALETGSVVAGYRISRLIGRGATGAVYLAEDADGGRVALKVLIPELATDARFRERFLARGRHRRIWTSRTSSRPSPPASTRDGLPRHGVRRRARSARDPQARGSPGACARRRPHASGRERARCRARARARAPRRQAGQRPRRHEACGRARLPVRLRARQAPLLGRRASPASGPSSARSPTSPEQIEGGTIDARADVYALGCMLFECLTGDAPFARESEVAAVYAHMNEPPPRVSDVRPGLPEGFDEVVAKALAKAPDDRYASAGELAAAGGAALRRGAAAPGPPAASARRARRSRCGSPARCGRRGGRRARERWRQQPRSVQRLAIAPKTLGLIDTRTARGRRARRLLEPALGRRLRRQDGLVLLGSERRVARVDLASRKTFPSVALPFDPGGITTGGGSAWVTEDGGPRAPRREHGRRRPVALDPHPGRA